YVLDSAEITVAGTLEREGDSWVVSVTTTGQKFLLEGPSAVTGAEAGSSIEIVGNWKTTGKGTSAREVIVPAETKQASHRPTRGDYGFVSAKFVPNDE